ncbi:cysteine synthase family protein [Elusimicrobiota bacterium]
MCSKIESKTTETIVLPVIRQLSDNLYSAVFELMKLMPAKYIFDVAEKEGILKKGGRVIESSSGTFGLALAMLCSERGYDLTLISDPVIDEPLRYRLEDLGAKIVIVTERSEKGGYQVSRLNKVYELMEKDPSVFWPRQYDNINNPGGYGPLAELLSGTVGKIDYLVGSVGSGGSTCGTARFLKAVSPDIRLVGIDSINSVIFGRPDKKRHLRGLGGSIIPGNVDHKAYDEVHWVNGAEGFAATRMLHRAHQLYMGPTSGASYMVAKWIAQQNKDAKVACVFADTGYRYELTVYSDKWLKENNLYQEELPEGPENVNSPAEAGPGWSRLEWNNRTYEEVMGKPFKLE